MLQPQGGFERLGAEGGRGRRRHRDVGQRGVEERYRADCPQAGRQDHRLEDAAVHVRV